MSYAPSVNFEAIADETVSVIPPMPAEVFLKRSLRLKSLASHHPVAEYLEAMARLAEAQATALKVVTSKEANRQLPAPFLHASDGMYERIWQKALEAIILEMEPFPLPQASCDALARLKSASSAELESAAQALLCGNYAAVNLAGAPFLAAALQVYWTDLASRVTPAPRNQTSFECPVCGSAPVAGVILSDRKLRYVCCSLCATHWYVPRLTCTNCGSTADLAYLGVDGEDGAKAESCKRCNTYLKLFYLETNPEAEAFADDLATLTLDLLMAGTPYSRSGSNLFLLSKSDL